MAPNGFLHAASVIALADSARGYGSFTALPEGAGKVIALFRCTQAVLWPKPRGGERPLALARPRR